jgi:hypothetical protein
MRWLRLSAPLRCSHGSTALHCLHLHHHARLLSGTRRLRSLAGDAPPPSVCSPPQRSCSPCCLGAAATQQTVVFSRLQTEIPAAPRPSACSGAVGASRRRRAVSCARASCLRHAEEMIGRGAALATGSAARAQLHARRPNKTLAQARRQCVGRGGHRSRPRDELKFPPCIRPCL